MIVFPAVTFELLTSAERAVLPLYQDWCHSVLNVSKNCCPILKRFAPTAVEVNMAKVTFAVKLMAC